MASSSLLLRHLHQSLQILVVPWSLPLRPRAAVSLFFFPCTFFNLKSCRQLFAETLVAVVETLHTLTLLYRVNAEVDVPAHLRTAAATELGDVARPDRKSASCAQEGVEGVRNAQTVEARSAPIGLVTLLALADIGPVSADRWARPPRRERHVRVSWRSKLSFHFDSFLVTVGSGTRRNEGDDIALVNAAKASASTAVDAASTSATLRQRRRELRLNACDFGYGQPSPRPEPRVLSRQVLRVSVHLSGSDLDTPTTTDHLSEQEKTGNERRRVAEDEHIVNEELQLYEAKGILDKANPESEDFDLIRYWEHLTNSANIAFRTSSVSGLIKETNTLRRSILSFRTIEMLQILKFIYRQDRISFCDDLIATEAEFSVDPEVTGTLLAQAELRNLNGWSTLPTMALWIEM
ncbi:hypothetical protein B0H14DRAFT_3474644 [Mycena olivaceomarginata]|nr:hypothetical protein B0H14DRAFT_3474644 [Mycena olivaceomarginata]